jgi:hypothetical protein
MAGYTDLHDPWLGQHTMKTQLLTTGVVILSVLFVAGCSQAPSQPTKTSTVGVSATTNSTASLTKPHDHIVPAGSINIVGLELSQFMPLYASLSDADLDTSQLGKLPPIIIRFKNTNDVTRSEAIRLLDQVLYQQAGIIASHPDAKHVHFKYGSSGNEKK